MSLGQTHVTLTGIMAVTSPPPNPSAVGVQNFMVSVNYEYCPQATDLLEKDVDLHVTYYSSTIDSPALVLYRVLLCSGTYVLDMSDPLNPRQELRADFVVCCPGEPTITPEAYFDAVPPLLFPQVSFVGTVVLHTNDSSRNPVFLVEVHTYHKKVQSSPKFSTFRLGCVLPNRSPRWTNFSIPYLQRAVFVSGTLRGMARHSNTTTPCIIINSCSYLPQFTKTDTASETAIATPSSSGTRKRFQQAADPYTSTPPPKMPRLQSPSTTNPTLPEMPSPPATGSIIQGMCPILLFSRPARFILVLGHYRF